ncbi:MAG: hypothetical protein JNL96_25965 [Planctomycetaceae bacterium]|nr:hypothetical protein [Planctomycetaceae bacterium]
MISSTLVNHCGARQVNAAELATIEPPAPTRTWFPLAHRAVLDSVCEAIEGAGFAICRSRLSVSHGGARFFGTLDLTTSIVEGVSLAVGIRNSNDQSFPIGFCCGQRVFVCDNLAFTSEIVVSKKHTRFGQERYLEGLARAVASLDQYRSSAAGWIEQMQARKLNDDRANSLLLQAYERKIIGLRLLPLVVDEWRNPTREEYRPRTAYSLFNCFTEVLGRERQSRFPAESALATMRLSKLLAPPERSAGSGTEIVTAA